jgi:hypothetical protein
MTGQAAVVSLLLQEGANMCKVDNERFTALIAASQMGYEVVLTALPEAGPEVQSQFMGGRLCF